MARINFWDPTGGQLSDCRQTTHLPGFFWHAILSKVEGFFENFEKTLLHAILPEV